MTRAFRDLCYTLFADGYRAKDADRIAEICNLTERELAFVVVQLTELERDSERMNGDAYV